MLIFYPVIVLISWLGMFLYDFLVIIIGKNPEIADNFYFGGAIMYGMYMDAPLNLLYFKITERIRNKGRLKIK